MTDSMNLGGRLEAMVVFALAILAMCIVLPIVLLVFAVAFMWHEPRIPVGVGLALLAVTAVVSAAGSGGVAEHLAVSAYACLALGVALLLIGLVRDWFKGAVGMG